MRASRASRDVLDGGLELAVVREGVQGILHVIVVVDLQASLEGNLDDELLSDGLVELAGDGLVELPGDGLVELPGDGLVEVPGDGLFKLPGDGVVELPGDLLSSLALEVEMISPGRLLVCPHEEVAGAG